MRSYNELELVRRLAADGTNNCEIARRTGIPVSTVQDWTSGGARSSEPWGRPGCARCGGPDHGFADLRSDAYAYLLGQYLGDGSIAHCARTTDLRITCCDSYPGIMDEVARAIGEIRPGGRVGRVASVGCTNVRAYWRAWPCLFPQHGPGPKHTRPIVLTDWQIEHCERAPHMLLRGLIHSDGCRCTNRVTSKAGKTYTYPRYLFNNESDDILLIFAAACERVGVRYRWCRDNMLSVARREDVARLDAFVGPKA